MLHRVRNCKIARLWTPGWLLGADLLELGRFSFHFCQLVAFAHRVLMYLAFGFTYSTTNIFFFLSFHAYRYFLLKEGECNSLITTLGICGHLFGFTLHVMTLPSYHHLLHAFTHSCTFSIISRNIYVVKFC